jgi:DNA polymerase-4
MFATSTRMTQACSKMDPRAVGGTAHSAAFGGRVILHVDMDAFFASVELRERPWLEGKPVVVGGDPEKRRGVVTAASYAARQYGISAGMPLVTAKRLCPHAVFLLGSYDGKYEHVSSRLREIFYRFTPAVEPYSIDEAFLDITGCERLFGPPVELAGKLKQRIRDELGLSCSVGVAPNKLLAKLASSLNKPDALTIISQENVQNLLGPLNVEKLCGIGDKTTRCLSDLGIHTLGQLASYPLEVLKSRFGKSGEWLHWAAQGIDHSPVLYHFVAEKSMSHERTLERDVDDPTEIQSVLLALSSMVARRLRERAVAGQTINLKIRFSDFATITRSKTIPQPTDSEHEIAKVAAGLVLGLGPGVGKIRLLGVGASRLMEQVHSGQTCLPIAPFFDKRRQVYPVIDRIRDRFGESAIAWGGACGRL